MSAKGLMENTKYSEFSKMYYGQMIPNVNILAVRGEYLKEKYGERLKNKSDIYLISWCVYIYVLIQPLCHRQDVTQGQFLSLVKMV